MHNLKSLGGYLLPITPDELRKTVQEAVGDAFRELVPQSTEESEKTPENALLSVAETATLLHVSRVTLREMEKRGELKPVRIGRRVLYRRSDIDAALVRGDER